MPPFAHKAHSAEALPNVLQALVAIRGRAQESKFEWDFLEMDKDLKGDVSRCLGPTIDLVSPVLLLNKSYYTFAWVPTIAVQTVTGVALLKKHLPTYKGEVWWCMYQWSHFGRL